MMNSEDVLGYSLYFISFFLHILPEPRPHDCQVGLVVSNAPSAPRYASFMADGSWKENVACRSLVAFDVSRDLKIARPAHRSLRLINFIVFACRMTCRSCSKAG